ncbi:uncharacterized protein [Epargyreus clarus]|uniref:uncharacterized protein n=1 Tax=Epargyreus clarus TaxID=520877 RepID=UPI003C2B4945
MHGVAVIINTKALSTPTTFVPESNRAMMIQIQSKPRNLNIIQLYAPTTEGSDEEVEEFYRQTEKLIRVTKKHDINIILGDMNAKVGRREVKGTVGKHGLGERNDRGDRLVQFCQDQNLVIMNTFFQLPPRRLYTWTSPRHKPDHIVRNQIDYIMINSRFKNCVKSAKTYPGADIRSDHNPVVAEILLVLKRIRKRRTNNIVNIRKIGSTNCKSEAAREINEWAMEAKHSQESVENQWSKLKTTVDKINADILKPDKWVAKEPWMSEKIYQLMEKRRLHKNDDKQYKSIDREIRREVRYARNTWYSKKCDRLEVLHNKHDAFNLHKEIRAMVGRKNPTHQLVDANNLPVLDPEDKKRIWEKYIKNMFADASRSSNADTNIHEGLPILKDEVRKALLKAKTGRAAGPDNVYIEVLKLVEEENLDALTKLMNLVYDTGQIPDDWLKSVFITLPKKPNAKKCEEFRTISLMSQVLKLLLSIIHERIRVKCDEQLGDNQFGFRSGVGTREALFAIQVLVQKCREMQQDVFLCFVDYEKAFDRVLHGRMLDILQDVGLDDKDIRFIRNLYWNQHATVRVDGEETNSVVIQKGVRQGCILSPLLFNLYSEDIITKALHNHDCGVKINGRNINNLRYADDTVLIASTAADLQQMVDSLEVYSSEAGLKMNVKKTKFMVISNTSHSTTRITVSGQNLERVQKYKYLGTWLNEDWNSDLEIKTRIEIARSAFNTMRKVLCSRSINIKLRTRLLHCYIWPIILYGCEAWTIKEDLRKRIEAFEMWTYRRLLSISWTQKVTNVKILERVGQKRALMLTVKQRKVSLGHVLRHPRYNLLQLIMMGKVAGRRKVGRRKKSWLRNIREWTGIASAAELFRRAKSKEGSKKLIANLQ